MLKKSVLLRKRQKKSMKLLKVAPNNDLVLTHMQRSARRIIMWMDTVILKSDTSLRSSTSPKVSFI